MCGGEVLPRGRNTLAWGEAETLRGRGANGDTRGEGERGGEIKGGLGHRERENKGEREGERKGQTERERERENGREGIEREKRERGEREEG